MKMYDVETWHVKQRELFAEVHEYVRGPALENDLYGVERDLFRAMLQLGRAFLGEAIARRGTGKVEGPLSVGGTELPFHMVKETTYLSVFGELAIARAYYWQPGQAGVFPLDEALNRPDHRYSYLLDQWLQGTIVEMPYTPSVSRFAELLQIPVSKLGQQTVAREAGAGFSAFYRQKPPFDPDTEGRLLGIQADGKGVRMIGREKPDGPPKEPKPGRGKGEKSGDLRRMAVATADFTFHPVPRSPEEVVQILMKELAGQTERRPPAGSSPKPRQALNVQVAAGMAGKQAAFAELAERVKRRDPEGEKRIVVFLDGEKALEEQLRTVFRQAGLEERIEAVVLDIMHLMEYLWQAATALYGEKARERTAWVRAHALMVLEGRVEELINKLQGLLAEGRRRRSQAKVLQKVLTYLENHRHMMHYDRYLAAGYPISTGLIEGTCGSLIKDRADRSGSRWSSAGVQAVLNLRAVMKNGDWDAYWSYYMRAEHERLYGRLSGSKSSTLEAEAT